MAARNYLNTAPPVGLSSDVDDAAIVWPVPTTAGYPSAPFTLTAERGTSNEEVALCTVKGPTSFTVTRAYDGTVAVAHASTAPIEHAVAAIDYREANFHINDQSHDQHTQYLRKSLLTAKGDLYVATGSGIIARLGIGADGLFLGADSGQTAGLGWSSPIPTGSLILYAGASAPTGYLLCNGALRTFGGGGTDDPLYQIIGSSFNIGGEGVSQFRLPNTQGRVLLGAGTGAGLSARALGTLAGLEAVALTSDTQLPSHQHGLASHTHAINHNHPSFTNTHSHGIDGDFGDRILVTVPTGNDYTVPPTASPKHQATSFSDIDDATLTIDVPSFNGSSGGPSTSLTSATGAAATHENMPPFLVVNVLIKR